MNRTFHRRVTPQGCVMAALPAVMSFWCFWMRTGLMPVAGLALLVLATIATERLIHTTYTFTADGTLVISNGHLSKAERISTASITGTRNAGGTLLVARHLIIEYGAGHITSVQPDNETAFLAELHRRLNETDKTQNL